MQDKVVIQSGERMKKVKFTQIGEEWDERTK